MSDFLIRLAERVLGTAPIVRPLIPPFYAQAPSTNDFLNRPNAESERARTEGNQLNENPVRRDRAAGADVSSLAVAAFELVNSYQEEKSKENKASEESYGKAPHEREEGTIIKSTIKQGRGDSAFILQSTKLATPPAQREFDGMSGRHLQTEEAPKDSRGAITPVHGEARIMPRVLVNAKTSPAEQRNQLIHNDGRSLLSRESIFPNDLQRSEAGMREVMREEYGSSATTVKVTIGRIDVRAIMPTASPPRPAKNARTGPALTLDDYLKNRSGGRR